MIEHPIIALATLTPQMEQSKVEKASVPAGLPCTYVDRGP